MQRAYGVPIAITRIVNIYEFFILLKDVLVKYNNIIYE